MTQLQVIPGTLGPSQDDTTPISNQNQRKNIMIEENNLENLKDLDVHEDNSDTSFATEQNSDESFRKCFEHTKKSDIRQTKNGSFI